MYKLFFLTESPEVKLSIVKSFQIFNKYKQI